jgi:hypothetical protein
MLSLVAQPGLNIATVTAMLRWGQLLDPRSVGSWWLGHDSRWTWACVMWHIMMLSNVPRGPCPFSWEEMAGLLEINHSKAGLPVSPSAAHLCLANVAFELCCTRLPWPSDCLL